VIAGGLRSSALTTLSLTWVDLDTNVWLIRLLMMARGMGFGFVLVPLQAATYATVSPQDTGRATALYNAASQVASSFGVAVAATLLTKRFSDRGVGFGNPAAIEAFQDVVLVLGILALAGTVVALLIRDSDAAATMARGTRVAPADVPPHEGLRPAS
jgi:hypothetical protein